MNAASAPSPAPLPGSSTALRTSDRPHSHAHSHAHSRGHGHDHPHAHPPATQAEGKAFHRHSARRPYRSLLCWSALGRLGLVAAMLATLWLAVAAVIA